MRLPLDSVRAKIRALRRTPRGRPRAIAAPGPGQESVWDYPRPPRVERVRRRFRLEFAGVTIAEGDEALRVLETSSPPTYYLPPHSVRCDLLERSESSSLCEWKGIATYWSLRVGDREVRDAAWSYAEPLPPFGDLRNYRSFYPGRVDACFLGGAPVRAQPGHFYGGWVTDEIVGPFKGEPGTESW